MFTLIVPYLKSSIRSDQRPYLIRLFVLYRSRMAKLCAMSANNFKTEIYKNYRWFGGRDNLSDKNLGTTYLYLNCTSIVYDRDRSST